MKLFTFSILGTPGIGLTENTHPTLATGLARITPALRASMHSGRSTNDSSNNNYNN